MEKDFGGITPSTDIPQTVTNDIQGNEEKRGIIARIKDWFTYKWSIKKSIITIVILVVLLIIIVGSIYAYIIHAGMKSSLGATVTPTQTPISTPTPTPTPLTMVNPLTGETLTGTAVSNLKRPPLAVMIENSTPARPQSGLNQADIVYETLAEGGITRFMGIFLGHTPSSVGPVRSARTYFLDWDSEYTAIYAHWGENSDVIPLLGTENIRNIDAIVQAGTEQSCNTGTGLFCRDNTRVAPHNGYGFPSRIWQSASSQGWSNPSTITSWNFKQDAPPNKRGADKLALSISFTPNDPDYDVKWVYDATNNIYVRFDTGVAQNDRLDGAAITAKNIIIQYVDGSLYTSSGGKVVYHLNDIGTGKAIVFEDGQQVTASWKKDSLTGRTLFFDASGDPIQFDQGRTWITVLANNTGSFTYN